MPPFIRQAAALWRDDDHRAFVDFIAANPEAGDVIPDSGGIRKVRWTRPGMGKRGGVRVIYYYHDDTMPLFLLSDLREGAARELDAGGEAARPGLDRATQTSAPEEIGQ